MTSGAKFGAYRHHEESDRAHRLACHRLCPGRHERLGGGDAGGLGRRESRLLFEKTDIRFRIIDKLRIEQVWMNVYHGGKLPSPHDQHLFIDNVVIARKYVGPMGRE